MAEIPLARLAAHMDANLDETMRAIKITMFNQVIRDTRVDTGRLRGNWQTTVGREASGQVERLDPTGAAASAEVAATVRPDTIDFLTNNLPYSELWNQRDGMTARAIARLERTIKEAAQ